MLQIPPAKTPVRKQKRAATSRQTRAEIIALEADRETDMNPKIPTAAFSAIRDAKPLIASIPTGQKSGQSVFQFEPLRWATIATAVVLAGMAGYFSITGMAAIFPGATLFGVTGGAAMAMDGAIEAGKLAGAAWLSRKWLDLGSVRYSLACLVGIAALINAVGVFGQLSAAHLNPHVAAVAVTDESAAANTTRIEIQQNLIGDLNRRIGQIDNAIDEATKRGRTTSALNIVTEQRQSRAELMADRLKAEGQMIQLRTEAARVAGDIKRANADVGVLQYAADTFNVDRERMIQLMILAMVLTCDPFSIALIVATSRRRK